MLRVGLDLRPTELDFKAHAGRGTGRYVTEVVRAMEPIAGDYGIELSPILSQDLQTNGFESTVLNYLPFGRRTFQSQVVFPRRVSRLNNELVHFFSHGDASAWGGLPQVVSVLDLIPLKFPNLYQAKKSNLRFSFARFLEYEAVRRAEGVVVISEATKRDVVELLGVAPEKIVVTPLAVDKRFLSSSSDPQQSREILEKYNLPKERPMLLYVGGIDPRKNVEFLVEVFADVVKNSGLSAAPYLVLAGGIESDDQYPRLCSKISSLGVEEDVFKLGYVPDKDLPGLYRAATLSVFPSLYEGFGLPVLESMACATPVIAANNSSIPEVVGEAFELLKDGCLEQWSRQILTYLENDSLLKEVSVKSVERAKHFSWERTAKGTLEAYAEFGGRTAKGIATEDQQGLKRASQRA